VVALGLKHEGSQGALPAGLVTGIVRGVEVRDTKALKQRFQN